MAYPRPFIRIVAWLPAVIVMIAIFILSHRQRISVSDEYWTNFIVFKTLHIVEYTVLTITYLVAYSFTPHLTRRKIARAALLSALLYACTDELHQTFVPTRQGSIRDVGIDLIGILCIYWLYLTPYGKKIQDALASRIHPRST